MRYDYVQITPKISRPLIPIKISNNNKFLLTEALIDSGSDYCIFPIEFADVLNVPIKKAKATILTGFLKGKANLYLHPINLAIDNYSFEIVAGIAENISSYAPSTLGQNGFFDNFEVCFDKPRHSISLDIFKK